MSSFSVVIRKRTADDYTRQKYGFVKVVVVVGLGFGGEVFGWLAAVGDPIIGPSAGAIHRATQPNCRA